MRPTVAILLSPGLSETVRSGIHYADHVLNLATGDDAHKGPIGRGRLFQAGPVGRLICGPTLIVWGSDAAITAQLDPANCSRSIVAVCTSRTHTRISERLRGLSEIRPRVTLCLGLSGAIRVFPDGSVQHNAGDEWESVPAIEPALDAPVLAPADDAAPAPANADATPENAPVAAESGTPAGPVPADDAGA